MQSARANNAKPYMHFRESSWLLFHHYLEYRMTNATYGIRAILFDMDGVLASVEGSYRESIIQTCDHFGVKITQDDISRVKKAGNANNDWILSLKLIEDYLGEEKVKSKKITLEKVTEIFETLYQGTENKLGLCEVEKLIPSKGLLRELCKRVNNNVAIVTGRPRKDR